MEVVNIISSWQGWVGLILATFFSFALFAIFLQYFLFTFYSKTKQEKRENGYRSLLMFLVCCWMGILIVPSFFEFSKVYILSDGTWKLKNGWNITLKTLKPNDPRSIKIYTKKVFWTGPSRQFTAANVYIVTNKKIYSSATDLPNTLENSTQKLKNSITKFKIPSSNNITSPIKFAQTLQQIKYVIYGLLALTLLIPEILKKIWPNKKII